MMKSGHGIPDVFSDRGPYFVELKCRDFDIHAPDVISTLSTIWIGGDGVYRR